MLARGARRQRWATQVKSGGEDLQVAAGERGKELPHLQGVEDIRATVVKGGAAVKIL